MGEDNGIALHPPTPTNDSGRIAEIYVAVMELRGEVKGLRQAMPALEKRVRVLEYWRWGTTATGTMIGAVLYWLVDLITGHLQQGGGKMP